MNLYLVAQVRPENCPITGSQLWTDESGVPQTKSEAIWLCQNMIDRHRGSAEQIEFQIYEIKRDNSPGVLRVWNTTNSILGKMCEDFWHDHCSDDASGLACFRERFSCIEKHWPDEVHKLASALYFRDRNMEAAE